MDEKYYNSVESALDGKGNIIKESSAINIQVVTNHVRYWVTQYDAPKGKQTEVCVCVCVCV